MANGRRRTGTAKILARRNLATFDCWFAPDLSRTVRSACIKNLANRASLLKHTIGIATLTARLKPGSIYRCEFSDISGAPRFSPYQISKTNRAPLLARGLALAQPTREALSTTSLAHTVNMGLNPCISFLLKRGQRLLLLSGQNRLQKHIEFCALS